MGVNVIVGGWSAASPGGEQLLGDVWPTFAQISSGGAHDFRLDMDGFKRSCAMIATGLTGGIHLGGGVTPAKPEVL